jgi:hypothetical protein
MASEKATELPHRQTSGSSALSDDAVPTSDPRDVSLSAFNFSETIRLRGFIAQQQVYCFAYPAGPIEQWFIL